MDQLNNLSEISTLVVVSTGLMMGLVSNIHCVGMCGGISWSVSKTFFQSALYQVGRLLGYISLTVLIPGLGIRALHIRDNKYLILFATFSIGFILISMGLSRLTSFKMGSMSESISKRLHKINSTLWPKIVTNFKNYPSVKSFLIGSISILLPCGLLWAAVTLAITAQSIPTAIAFIFAFWLGTLPGLLFSRPLLQGISKKFGESKLLPLLLIVIGLGSIIYRLYLVFYATGGESCH